MDPLTITVPTTSDGRHSAVIDIDEIAMMKSHTVVSYSYQEWTEVYLKSGVMVDCARGLQELKDAIAKRRRDAL